ncbi:MAG: MlaD family protein, partial [Nitrospirota bacterium]
FVLIAIILLAYLTFQVSEFRLIKEKGYEIDVLFDSVGGLDLKSSVRIAGVEVGKVAKIELENGKAKVTLRVFPDITIPKGAKALIKATGLMGEKYVEIVPGDKAETLKEHERIVQGAPPADIDKLINQLSSIAEDIRNLSKNLNKLVDVNKNALSNAIKNFEEFSAMLKNDTPQLIAKLNSITGKIEKGEGTIGKLVTDEELYRNLSSTVEKLNKIAEKIEKGEGTIGKLVTDDQVYENLNETLVGIKDYVAKAEAFKTTVGFRSEYLFKDIAAKGYLTLQLKPREDKYYIFEIVSDPWGRVTTTDTETQTTTGGVTTTTVTHEEKKEESLKFSIEFAKRYEDLILRIGMIENTFGVGADYFLFKDVLQLNVDAWDFTNKDSWDFDRSRHYQKRPHLKAGAQVNFLKNFFVYGGYDNFLNTDRDNFYAGAGLKFDDDDLKYLLGKVPLPGT